MILHCIFYFISLIISDIEHLFICLLTIYVSSLGKCLFRPSTHLLIGFFFFFLIELHELLQKLCNFVQINFFSALHIFFWSILDLQCCVYLQCKAKRFSYTHTHTYIYTHTHIFQCFPSGTSGKESACQCRRCKRHQFDPWVWMIPWRKARQPAPVFLPRESHGQMSLQSVGLHSQMQLKRLSMHACIYMHIHFSHCFPL